MVKSKRSLKNLELDITVAKTGNSTFSCSKQQIPWQTENSVAFHENLHAAEYCWPCSSSYILSTVSYIFITLYFTAFTVLHSLHVKISMLIIPDISS